MSFILACDNLGGKNLKHSIAFQQLRKAKKIMYQCSASSTGPEIAARVATPSNRNAELMARAMKLKKEREEARLKVVEEARARRFRASIDDMRELVSSMCLFVACGIGASHRRYLLHELFFLHFM